MAKKEEIKAAKPAIIVSSPFGDEDKVTDSREDHYSKDWFYVHGYSDKRQDWEEARAKGQKPASLPFRMQFVSTTRASGQPMNERVSMFKGRKYIPVMYDEAHKYGIDVNKSAFVKEADGTCRQGSQMLMVCAADVAAAHAKKVAQATKDLSESVRATANRAAEDYNARYPGGTPTSFDFEEKTGRDAPGPFDFEDKLQ